ncbi:hypothetical protein [Streptococcus pantholopis]|uniref:Membrane associated protein n=1 Tax=Streptococcus pantholopis TaxID=1811193 RepID=A0A172Q958_9STRE|nr:hypothetical protein [Streptococcus pantholopis]AND80004.1 hypothetical protein A0O21_08310 [Streptococcus pantholopis]
MPYYGRPPRRKFSFTFLIGILFILLLLNTAIEHFLPILLLLGTGGGVYYLTTRKSRLEKANISRRLQDLKDSIRLADRQIKLLDSYLDAKEYAQYSVVGRQLLPKLEEIKAEADSLKNNMDIAIYKRVTKKAEAFETDIKLQLEKLHISTAAEPVGQAENDLFHQAPELIKVYDSIQTDHQAILKKIEEADNKAELTALHQANMQRFQDILDGYLKIKSTPKNYYNAEERLEKAKAALEQFDLDLDETLRQLNESDLKDFDVSLRMMGQKADNL